MITEEQMLKILSDIDAVLEAALNGDVISDVSNHEVIGLLDDIVYTAEEGIRVIKGQLETPKT